MLFRSIEAGKLTLEQVDFDLRELIGRTLGLVSEPALAKGVALDLEVDPDLDELRGDPTRLSQVLLNLLNNAVKFTEQGRVGLSVGVVGRSSAGWRLRFEVADTGIGIEADRVGRLFTSFEQGDTSTARRFGGTGLGLAITQRLVQLMGGEVGVDSQPGRGSRFWFTAEFGAAQARPAAPGRQIGRAHV